MKRPVMQSGAIVTLVAIAAVGTSAAAPKSPGHDELAAIAERGRHLTAYDQASWHAGDAWAELHPDTSRVACYLAQEQGDGTWRVVWGKRSEADDAFLIAYDATQSGSPTSFIAKANETPVRDTDFFLRASFALDTARAAFGKVQRPYNAAVLPVPDGTWLVYMFPASTTADVWPIGGDERFTITRDGRTITESRRLHQSILDIPMDQEKSEGGFHTHVLACIPEDTDVLAVLSRTPRVPEYITCNPFSYAVDPDGTIRYLGLTKKLFPGVKMKAPR